MIKPILTVIFLLILYTAVFANICEGYDSKTTHRYINSEVLKIENSSIDNVLKTLLNFRDGIEDEDLPSWRCLRHFHDLLNSNWDNAGFQSLYHSMFYWAQTPEPSIPFGLFNEYSLTLANKHYHQALLPGSEEQYAKSFCSVGHLMHLISDAAVTKKDCGGLKNTDMKFLQYKSV
jgi:hypothetical protein